MAVKGKKTGQFRWKHEGLVCLTIFATLSGIAWSSALVLQSVTMLRSHRLMYWKQYLAHQPPRE